MGRIYQWLKYYRAALIDGSIKPKDNVYESKVGHQDTCPSRLSQTEIDEWQATCKQNLFVVGEKGKEKEADIINIEIATIFLVNRESEHTKNKTDASNDKQYPFWIRARMSREGVLFPPDEDDMPVFLRPYLAPNPKDSPTIAEMDRLDEVLSGWTVEKSSWKDYWKNCEKFFTAITGKTYRDFHGDQILFGFCKYGDINTIRNIRRLYDQLLDDELEPENGLLREILKERPNPENREFIPEGGNESRKQIFLNGNHYGQMRCDFPLSRSQRVALAEYLEDDGLVFAVNGPPGTGKTTLLQSVLANHVVQSVLAEREPMLIVGFSTNNQAITNILDSMSIEENGSNRLAERWLPGVSSFGLYLTSEQKNKGESDDKKYQIATSCYLKEGFVGDIDQKEKTEEYEVYFIRQATELLGLAPNVTGTKVKTALKKKINVAKLAIDKALDTTAAYLDIPQILKSQGWTSVVNLDTAIEGITREIKQELEFQHLLKSISDQLAECHKRLPVLYQYFPLGRCKKYRKNKYQIVIAPIAGLIAPNTELDKYRRIEMEIDRLKLVSLNQLKSLGEQGQRLDALREDITQRKRKYKSLFDMWEQPYIDRWKRLVNKNPDFNNLPADEYMALRLDVSYRYDLFWLCVHYREIEFVEKLRMKDSQDKERGQTNYEAKLRRLALVTPLFISTFHSLPRFSNYYSRIGGETFYRDLFDLMIVDEAGQVAPEVAVASLALTKRILAVGDTKQIEPVFGVTDKIDFINARKYGLLTSDDQFDKLCNLGFMTSECSLMQLVKKSCSYKFAFENGKCDKGAYLREHYRCLDDIVRYSNEYVYDHCLVLQGGKVCSKEHGLPPLGYVHVNGSDEAHHKSRRNDLEARVIVEWIYRNLTKIERAYGRDIGKVLAVVTPFKAQIGLIEQYLQEWFGKTDCPELTVGTIHTLQGAGKEIVLFSSVYGQDNGRMFFDLGNKYNMLNVAVTRAKHSFIVFGNMKIFQPHRNTPSGNLAKVLFAKEEFNLSQDFIYASERIYKSTDEYKVVRLSTLERHVDCLKYCFQEVKERLLIFSPFISIIALQSDGITDSIRQTVGQRNVDIRIVTDEQMDKQGTKLKEAALKGRQALSEAGARVIVYRGVHNKTICMDDSLLVEGSFNWLSAVRDNNSPYCRQESSVFITGGKVKEMIEKVVEDFMLEDKIN